MSIKKREIEEKIKEAAKQYPVISVTGPRQSGKTTLLRQLFSKYDYVSLENEDVREFAQNDPKEFLKRYSSQVIFDEVQRVPKLFSYIQTKVDEDKVMGQYILSGSQNFLLMESISQSLAGRVAIFKLMPFSFSEIGINKEDSVAELLFKGAYPPVYDRKLNSVEWASNYIETYIQKDVTQIKEVSNLAVFKRFLVLLAARNGQLLNLSSLGRDCGVSHNTINSWLSILEASYIIHFLQPFTTHTSSRVIKSPKLYFYDTAIVCALLKIKSADELFTHPAKGTLFETVMINEMKKHYFNTNQLFNGYFWRDSKGHEIDLIIEKINGKAIDIVEIKSSSTLRQEFFNELLAFKSKTSIRDINSYLLYTGLEHQKRQGISCLSWINCNTIWA